MKTYLYRVSYSWWEEYKPYILIHEKKFSREEWEKMIKEAMNKALKELLLEDDFIGMNSLLDKVKEILCKDYGFKEASFVQTFDLWGSIIIDRDDRDEIKELSKYFDEQLIEEIIRHNEKIRASIFSKTKTRLYR